MYVVRYFFLLFSLVFLLSQELLGVQWRCFFLNLSFPRFRVASPTDAEARNKEKEKEKEGDDDDDDDDESKGKGKGKGKSVSPASHTCRGR